MRPSLLPPPHQSINAAPAAERQQEQTNERTNRRSSGGQATSEQGQQTAMGSRGLRLLLLRLLLVSAVVLAALSGSRAGEQPQVDQLVGWIPTRSACKGTIAECLAGDEFALDSESNRRILATTGYISYAALQRGSVPCSRRGASYYNCRAGAPANPYRRGCSAITRCRS